MSMWHGFYRLTDLDKLNNTYNIIFSGRGTGKSYAIAERVIDNYMKSNGKEQAVYLRRWHDDILGFRLDKVFSALQADGKIKKLTSGIWENVTVKNKAFYLSKTFDGKEILDKKPICYALSLSDLEHDKSTSYPNVTLIWFDEFISRSHYFVNEVAIFYNAISTIVRLRKNVKIYLLGNTINKYNPYFTSWNIPNDIKQGEVIEVVCGKQTISVEYPKSTSKQIDNSIVDFGDSHSNMIVSGEWETNNYPKIEKPKKGFQTIIRLEILGISIYCASYITNNSKFIYVGEKETLLSEIKIHKRKTKNMLTCSTKPNPSIYWTQGFLANNKTVALYLKPFIDSINSNKIFFDTDDTGEIFNNWLHISKIRMVD